MYLNIVQIAESFGVSESVVEGWVRNEGMPHTPERGRLLFDRAQVVQWAAARGLATKAGFLTPEQSAFTTGCDLAPLLRRGGIYRDLPAASVLDVIGKVVDTLPGVAQPVQQLLRQRLRAPGGVIWAAVGGGFALPHLSTRVALGRDSGTLALLLLRDPLTQAGPTPDDAPITSLLFFIAPSPRAHLDVLGRLTRALSQGPLRELILKGAADTEIIAAIGPADNGSGNGNKTEVKR
ncbi:MAG TPA: PTS sugar transporter subunit IIA [Verrucomicrobiae bacterium]|nr:PTS sugar transporter subunit IIA [Verrucomicrobiae bacterium]